MEFYVVYFNPSDFPGLYVVRRQVAQRDGKVHKDAEPAGKSNSLAQVRCSIPNGKLRFMPDPNDDPCIVEVWF